MSRRPLRMHSFFVRPPSILTVFIALCGCCLVLQLTACGECKFDADCGPDALCNEGACQAKDKPKPRPNTECLADERRPCYEGPQETIGQGICKGGFQTCVDGFWSKCQGAVLPEEKEACDGIDNNCNAQVDEGCSCQNGAKQKCYTGSSNTRNQGKCRDGEQICINGEWGACIDQKLPQAEECNNEDDDCNGLIDDNVRRSCKTDCAPGEEICSAGRFAVCNAPKPTAEKCGDDKDNNCDGSVDEGCECKPNTTRKCYTGAQGTEGVGPCKGGTQTCSADGKWQSCDGQILPKVESCNDKDDDCNGKSDDALQRPCQRGCNSGIELCSAGQWKACNAAAADPEVCDGKDNDCNGKTDDIGNGASCECRIGQEEICYDGPKATLNKGPCKAGKRLCQSTGKWSLCLNQLIPGPETCNGKDDDCDGQTDNQPGSGQALQQPCYTGAPNTTDVGECKKGVQTCQNNAWSTCTNQTLPKTETCNNKDDDCDGKVDEDLFKDCYSGAAGTDGKGECKKGRETCSKGIWSSCQGEVTPKAETCNQKDDDCDGQSDEGGVCDVCTAGETQACYSGPTNTRNISPCKDGSANCVGGQWGTCQNEVLPTTETCNNKDDDCDGKVDDALSRPCSSSCGAGVEICSAGAWINCNAPKPATETCNNKDDDCNGQIDDGISCTILATSDWSGKIFTWNPFSRTKLLNINHGSRINRLKFSPDKQTLAAVGSSSAKLWNPETGALKQNLSIGSTNARSVAFSPDSKTLAIGTDANEIQLWDLTTYKILRRISNHSGYVRSLAFTPNGSTLISSSTSNVYLWDPSTGTQKTKISASYTVTTLAISPDGKTLLTGGYTSNFSGRMHAWNLANTPPTQTLSYPATNYVYEVSFSPDGSLVTAATVGSVLVWKTSNSQKIADIKLANTWLYTSGITPDNKTLAAGGRASGATGHLYLWDISGTTPSQTLHNTDHPNYLWSLTFRP